ncbi:unnamed protein product [Linum trigynum]|uniref:Protein PRD1 n=1 Tax=Linum trigynum TaxID=586398 RepID=A0AAV2G290_9ROSI
MYYTELDPQFQSPSPAATTAGDSCSRGHRSSLCIATIEGGSICLVCVSNLIANPRSLSHHVAYALTQLSAALSQPQFLETLLTFHPHYLVSPLIHALSLFPDPAIAGQLFHLISALSAARQLPLAPHFLAGLADRISSSAFSWTPAHLHILHCFGIILSYAHVDDPYAHVKDSVALLSNLVTALQLPSEDIQAEVLFVLYRLSLHGGDDEGGILLSFCPKLLRLSLEALLKTQNDAARLNSIALLKVLARRGCFENTYQNDICSTGSDEADSLMQTIDDRLDASPLSVLFAEAIKGSLLSSDRQIQASALDLIIHYLTREGTPCKEAEILLEENIVDYVFEILRLSECTDPVINSCLLVLDLLSAAEKGFIERLVVGLSTLVPVLCYIAEVPFHPVQYQALKLISSGLSNCPGIVSSSHVEEVFLALTKMLKRHADGELGMSVEAFTMVCSMFVTLLESLPLQDNPDLAERVQEATNHAILACLNASDKDPRQLLHAFHLVKEAYNRGSFGITSIRNCIINICTAHLLPWIIAAFDEVDEEVLLGLLETFQHILVQDSDNQASHLANAMVTSSWFSWSFGCMGLFPTESMKVEVYLLFSSLVDVLGTGIGLHIREAAADLPTDPIDLLFLLGQKSSQDTLLSCCQSAVLLIFHTSSLYDDRVADEKSILASLEQYVLVNRSKLFCSGSDTWKAMQLINLYGLCRGLANGQDPISYSLEVENIVLQLVAQDDWDLLSSRLHFVSLKWWFRQEKIHKLLGNQILKFCRTNPSNEICMPGPEDINQSLNLRVIAELATSGDNHVARILICLLVLLVEEEHQEEDIILVLNLMKSIIRTSPASVDEFCLNGMGNVLRTLYYSPYFSSSPQLFMACQSSVSIILRCVNPEALCDDQAWLAVTVKMIDCIASPRMASKTLSDEGMQVVTNFCFILHHSTKKALLDASKTILFNSSLVSMVDDMVHAACSKGPALVDYDEGTSSGENLTVMLLLSYFSLKSIHSLLPDSVDWQTLLKPSNDTGSPTIGINCTDLCRLMHFGSPAFKLISSYCLVELFTRVTEQRNKNHEVKCAKSYLMSVAAILEGLMFDSNIRVSMNCGLCLSMLLSWERLDLEEEYWCKLIVEEMATSLAVPCLASKSFVNNHKPAVHVTATLLKIQKSPAWMRSVLDEACIDGILKNATGNNMMKEILLLFRELMNSKFLKKDQKASLNRLLQECRKHAYAEESRDESKGDNIDGNKKRERGADDLGEVCEYLIHLMMSADLNPQGQSRRLLEEVEMFSKTIPMEAR